MKRYCFYFLIPFILFFGCKSESGEREVKDNKQKTSALKRLSSAISTNETEFTDSLQIKKFLSGNPQFKPYQKKLYKFYTRRDYKLAWSDKGEFLPQVSMFINILRNATNEGMDPGSFDIQKLEKELNQAERRSAKGKSLRKEIDLLLSASYFKYSRKIWKGIIHPQKEGLNWYVNRKKIKFGKTLDSILDSNEKNPFTKYMPLHQEYHNLLKVLYKYRNLAKKGGWPQITLKDQKVLKPGDTSSIVIDLRKRLALTGDLKKASSDSVFSSSLTNALKYFQERHGLKPDGLLGPKTIEALNIPVNKKIKQILINLERWRWVPDIKSSNYLMVNIPEYKLRIYEDEQEVKEMKVIVGKVMNSTPVFNDKLEYIVVNPYWNIPKSIAVKEILPALKKNPGYLKSQNMEVFIGYDYSNPLDPFEIDWNSVSEKSFPYQFRQKPGPYNSLGQIKFLFPNNFSVYLHDTPADHLFNQTERDFSHGCIRVEEPVWLAGYILNQWKEKEIKNLLGQENKWIKLNESEKLPVYIVYFTVWTNSESKVHFRNDIYNHDKQLERLLFEK